MGKCLINVRKQKKKDLKYSKKWKIIYLCKCVFHGIRLLRLIED